MSIASVVVAGALYLGGKYSHSVKDVFAIEESFVSQVSPTPLEETVNPIDPCVEPDYVVLDPDAPPLDFDTFSASSDSYASRIREALSFQSTEERTAKLRLVIDDYICRDLPRSMMIINDKYVQDDSKINHKDRPMSLDIIYGLKGSNSPVTALESLYDLMTSYGVDGDHSLRTAFVVYARTALDLMDAAPETLVAKTFPCQELSKKEKEEEEMARKEKERKGESK